MEQYATAPGGAINRSTGKDLDGVEEAVQDFLAGGEEGFDYIFRQYYPPLCYLAFSLLGNRPAAEDIVSESFLKLWQRRGKLGARGSLHAWLYTAVHRACIDALRREKRKGLYLTYSKRSAEREDRPVLHRLIEAETLRQVYGALKTLPPRCGQVLRMYYLEEKSLQEIATELNLSLSTVKSQKGRAVELLRKRVGSLFVL